METYEVIDASKSGQRVALIDRQGKLHVARVLAEAPMQGELLSGDAAAPGPRSLVSPATSEVFRVVFELVGCTQQAALERLHPPA